MDSVWCRERRGEVTVGEKGYLCVDREVIPYVFFSDMEETERGRKE